MCVIVYYSLPVHVRAYVLRAHDHSHTPTRTHTNMHTRIKNSADTMHSVPKYTMRQEHQTRTRDVNVFTLHLHCHAICICTLTRTHQRARWENTTIGMRALTVGWTCSKIHVSVQAARVQGERGNHCTMHSVPAGRTALGEHASKVDYVGAQSLQYTIS